MRPMSPAELNECLSLLVWSPMDCAKFFDVAYRTVARWRDGSSPVPRAVCMLLRLLACGELTEAEALSVRPVNPGVSTNA